MKKLPIINFDKFEKNCYRRQLVSNCEVFWHYHHELNTHHCQVNNSQLEGVEIVWEGDPFHLIYNLGFIYLKG